VGALLATSVTPGWAAPGTQPERRDQQFSAVEEPDPYELAEVAPLETPGIDPVLDGVRVTESPAIERAQARLERVITDQGEATLRWVEVERRRGEAAAAFASSTERAAAARQALIDRVVNLARLDDRLGELRRAQDLLRVRLGEEQAVLRGLAAEVLSSTTDDRYAVFSRFSDWTEADRRGSVRDRAIDLQSDAVEQARRPWATARDERRVQAADVRAARAATAEASDQVAEAADERARIDALLTTIGEESQRAKGTVDDAAAASTEAIEARRAVRLEARVRDLGMPLVALHAYWRASSLAPCPIPWWTLAGIGRVESRHGSAQGARLTAAGDTTVAIRGIPLDGRPGTQAIADSDGGRLDGDSTWDRAVGPMQFIPGTWGRWALDANADDDADPHNIYDAALAAARYLCFARGPLTTDGAIRTALLAYNRSVAYGTKVIAEGRRYFDALDLPALATLPAGARPPVGRDEG
jgi:hypothetical protein